MSKPRRGLVLLLLALASHFPGSAIASDAAHELQLPEEPIELATLPERPRPILEIGNDYLAPVEISEGIALPTGAVWQPSLLAWGTLRSAMQAKTGAGTDEAQWANRLDLFGQLSLTATERFVIGLEPFQSGTKFSGYRFGVDGADAEGVGDVEAGIQTLFFEGDVGELFPRLDRNRWWPLDVGFMVGRVPIVFQDGFLLDDRMTGVGLVQNSILAPGTSNLRLSVVTAWDAVNRGNNARGGNTKLSGFSSEADFLNSTWALDAVYVDGTKRTDGVVAGVSMIRRIRERLNVTARVLGSYASQRETPLLDDGLLGVLSLSLAPKGTHNIAYLNVAASYQNYTAAARSADRGGPLGRMGVLFEAPGLGSIGSPLDNDANRFFAGVVGYQVFFSGGRAQLVLEAAGRARYAAVRDGTVGVGVRFQHAIGRRAMIRIDGYGGHTKGTHGFVGGRSELVIKF
ncbi:MAG: hypothetical protein ACI8TX_004029 [Hyphomicrobiaceae bacterium]|jgi:hypothetical protein